MSQDTRKDPRAKVLTMTVRYKSATLDEFIEHHSYDVSRGGMFIKTPSPFPPGTLLKFEVKIAADQKVIQGVGRVVWKRDGEGGSGDTRPAGMGVKFIKIDDASRKVIDALVESRGDASSAYDAGGGDNGTVPQVSAAPPSAVKAPAAAASATSTEPAKMRKATMIGLGAINPANRPAPAAPTPVQPAVDKPAASFFPETKSQLDMPAPEDRTMMKQAAELLQDALRETGSSMEEVASSSKYEPAPVKASEREAAAPRSQRSDAPTAAKAASAPLAAAQKSERPVPRKSAVSEAPPNRRVAVPVQAPAEKGGGARVFVIAIAIAAAAGLVVLVNKNNTPPPPAPTPASAEPAPPPVASVAPPPPVPADTASAAPAESVAPAASAAPVVSAPASASAVAPAVPLKPVVAAKPVLQAKPVPKPKPVVAPTEPVAPGVPTAEKPAPTPKPEKPAPKPKPVEPAGDNPY